MKINEIFLSSEDRKEVYLEAQEGQTDVIVITNTGEKFMASFFSFKRLQELLEKNKSTQEFLSGAYFWMKDMILIEHCDKKSIKKVIHHLLEEGDFQTAFKKIETN